MTQFKTDQDCFQADTDQFSIAFSSSMDILGRVPEYHDSEISRLLPNSSNPVLTNGVHQPTDVFNEFLNDNMSGTQCSRLAGCLKDSNINDWRYKHVTEWLPHDTCFWVHAVADTMGYDYNEALQYMNKFSQTTGAELVSMSLNDFLCITMEHEFATRLFTSLQEIANRNQQSEQYEILATLHSLSPLETNHERRNIYENGTENPPVYNNNQYDFDPSNLYDNQVSNIYDSGIEDNVSLGDGSSDSEQCEDYEFFTKSGEENYSTKKEEKSSKVKTRDGKVPGKRGPGRPPGTKKAKPEKIGKVWEFVRDLLLDPQYNPSVICWVDQENGIFKFVQSDAAAKLWGIKKNNEKMTFDKLTRAMRYYYKHGIFRSSTKRLFYGFGPEATGWKIENTVNH